MVSSLHRLSSNPLVECNINLVTSKAPCTVLAPSDIATYFNLANAHRAKGCLRISSEKLFVLEAVNMMAAEDVLKDRVDVITGIKLIFDRILFFQSLYVKSIECKGFDYHISEDNVLRIAPKPLTSVDIRVSPKEIVTDLKQFSSSFAAKKRFSIYPNQKIIFQNAESSDTESIKTAFRKENNMTDAVNAVKKIVEKLNVSIQCLISPDKDAQAEQNSMEVEASTTKHYFSITSSRGITFSLIEKEPADQKADEPADEKDIDWRFAEDVDPDEETVFELSGDEGDGGDEASDISRAPSDAVSISPTDSTDSSEASKTVEESVGSESCHFTVQ